MKPSHIHDSFKKSMKSFNKMNTPRNDVNNKERHTDFLNQDLDVIQSEDKIQKDREYSQKKTEEISEEKVMR